MRDCVVTGIVTEVEKRFDADDITCCVMVDSDNWAELGVVVDVDDDDIT